MLLCVLGNTAPWVQVVSGCAVLSVVQKKIESQETDHTVVAGLASVGLPQTARDAVEATPELLVRALADYTRCMTGVGLFEPAELPLNVDAAFHGHRYLTQVREGGHGQFLANAAPLPAGGLADAMVCVLRALRASGAQAHLKVFQDFAIWVDNHPDPVQTLMQEERDPFLADLDHRFAAAEGDHGLMAHLACWIAGWSHVDWLADDKVALVWEYSAALNPARGERLQLRRLDQYRAYLTEDVRLAIGLAAVRCEQFEFVMNIGSGSYYPIEGRQALLWSVKTSAGMRFAEVMPDGGCVLRSCITEESEPLAVYDVAASLPTRPGTPLGFVTAGEVQEARALVVRNQVAESVLALLSSLEDPPHVAGLTLATAAADEQEDPFFRVLIWTGAAQGLLVAEMGSKGAMLLSLPGRKPLMRIPADQIAAFVAALPA